MSDAGLRQIFRTHLVPRRFFLQAIESGSTAGGIPDLYYAHSTIHFSRACGWVECKTTDGWAVSFRPAQIGWLEAHARYGGRGWVAVRKLAKAGPRREAADELWLYRATEARELADHGLDRAGAHCIGRNGAANWPWEEVASLLIGS